jgi:hypothetical protein
MCFLMDMMEWRERIEELDGEERQQDELQKIWTETQSRKRQCLDSLNDIFDTLAELPPPSPAASRQRHTSSDAVGVSDRDIEGDEDSAENRLLQQARKYTAQIQYWHRLETTLRERMDL